MNISRAAYYYCEFFAELGGNEAEYKAANSNASPEPGGYHTRLEIATCTFPSHKGNNPATKSNFRSDITKKKYGRDPGHAAFECLSQAASPAYSRPRVFCAIHTTRDWPECPK